MIIRHDPKPGDMGSVIYLHGVLYAEEYGFDHTFESYVAAPLAEFVISHTDRERLWIVEQNGEVKGSIAIVMSSEDEAQLRWLIVHPDLRGRGIGKRLVREAVTFCRERGYGSIFLWTVRELTPAINLYKSMGFVKTDEKTHEIWGRSLTEERFDLKMEPPGNPGPEE